jgi:hypothetical protein
LVEFIKINPRLYFGLTDPQMVSLVSTLGGSLLFAIIVAKHQAGFID